jgi:hypothetical protein
VSFQAIDDALSQRRLAREDSKSLIIKRSIPQEIKMLQKIQRTAFDELVAFIKGDDTIAHDPESGATLYKSDGQYVLVVQDTPYHRRYHWSRRTIQSDEAAIQRAQKVIERQAAQ